MKKLYLLKNKECFQGENYLKKNKTYFEGWYFKNTSDNLNISFIPGINITKNKQEAFIQVITKNTSYYINYDIKDFHYNHSPLFIKIANNYFSKNKIHIDINNKDIKIYGDLNYTNSKNINTNILNPNIMGPFSYIPFMECNHAIISMKNNINGKLTINNNEFIFNNGTGYIEKDWGISFPKNYIWIEGNNFKNKNASFMLSIANIPFKIFSFKGFICSLIINNKEYRFSTYNNSKIIKYDIDENKVNIILKRVKYYLYVEAEYNNKFKLKAPVKGSMEKDIYESIDSKIKITLKENDNIIFEDISINAGLEIVK